jgi:ParB family chromosome partitioning protein
MRHDAHYVEELSKPQPTSIGKILPIDKIDPNPEQPRVDVGDLTELTDSIREKGILEPLLVKQLQNNRWLIIAGERRWRAARNAGLKEVPCIEIDADDRGVAEIALIENLQRKDLTIWEEVEGFASLCLRFGYTHEEVAKRVGKSRTSITESISIAGLPSDIKNECQKANINTKTILLQIARQPDEESMVRMTKEVIGKGLNRDEARLVRRRQQYSGYAEDETRRPATYKYKSQFGKFNLQVTFSEGDVPNDMIVEALEEAIRHFTDW